MSLRTFALLLLGACGSGEAKPGPDEEPAETEPAPTPVPTQSEPPAAGPIDPSWVEQRVRDAHERLRASEAGRLVWRAIEAHGGLEGWLSSGTVSFTFDYAPVGDPSRRRYTENRIDLWRARAWQRELGEGADATIGWDGERAWVTPGPDAWQGSARFWALTPYYFVGIPFVMADPGTRFERLPDADHDGVAHRMVKVTYEDDTGDSPDDYYILYIHPETHRVSAIRYVVAYPGFFAEGEHSPEKLMRYGDQREVSGLFIAHRFDTYAFDPETGQPGDKVTDVTASTVGFGAEWPATLFAPPEGAAVIEEIEPREPR